MASHRYWRLTGFLTDSNALELSQAQLYDGGTLIAQAPVFSVAPTTGTAFPDTLRWDDFSMPGFALTWNLATPVADPSLRLGAGSSAYNFPKEFYCQYSDDGQLWFTNNAPANVAFPGAGLLTAEPSAGSGGAVLQSYRYFQFKVLNSDHPDFLAVCEITALNGGAPVSLLGKAYSANIGWLGDPSAVFDGELTNFFGVHVSDLPLRLNIDLGVAAKVTAFNILATNASFSAVTCAFHDFDILGSQDGVQYDTLATVRNAASWVLSEQRNFTLTAPAAQSGAAGESVFIPLSATPQANRWRLVGKGQEGIAGSELPPLDMTEVTLEKSFMDAYHGGQGRIYGTVAEKGTPNKAISREVLLIDEASSLVIRKTWSDPVTGVYTFWGIRENVKYTIISYDYSNNYRAVVADNQTPYLLI